MQKSVAHSHNETSTKLHDLLTTLGNKTGQLIAGMDERNESSLRQQQETSAAFALETQSTVESLAKQVEKLTKGVEEATGTMRSAVTDLAKGSNESISLMGRGADTLNTAANRFGGSLEGFACSANSVVETSKALGESAQKLQAVVTLSNQALSGHQSAQQAFSMMVNDLKETISNASRDARLTSELVGKLEAAGRKMAEVQEQADHYLESVNKVLIETHAAFANSIKGTLREGNKDFHAELGKAVDVLRGAILDLGNTLDFAPAKG
jgi:predicted transcriptional regulator